MALRRKASHRSHRRVKRSRRELRKISALSEIEYAAPYTEAALQNARSICDPLADAVIADLRRTHPIKNPDDMLAIVRQKAGREGGVYAEFIDTCCDVPEWVDFDAMRRGQRLIAVTGPLMGLSLLSGSLVGGYIFYKAAMVTAFTGRLGMPGDISRRLVETAALIFYMSRPEEIRPGGKAHEILMRVRLLHGAIRQWTRDSDRWKEEWDQPINQEDLAITMSEFSYLNVRSLLRMGVRLSDEEIDAHFALWRYAGHVLGIQDFLLPETFEQEIEQFGPMLKHQARPDSSFGAATRILDEIADKSPLPQAISRDFLYQVTAFLVGEELVAGLDIKPRRFYPGIGILFQRSAWPVAGAGMQHDGSGFGPGNHRKGLAQTCLLACGHERFDQRTANAFALMSAVDIDAGFAGIAKSLTRVKPCGIRIAMTAPPSSRATSHGYPPSSTRAILERISAASGSSVSNVAVLWAT